MARRGLQSANVGLKNRFESVLDFSGDVGICDSGLTYKKTVRVCRKAYFIRFIHSDGRLCSCSFVLLLYVTSVVQDVNASSFFLLFFSDGCVLFFQASLYRKVCRGVSNIVPASDKSLYGGVFSRDYIRLGRKALS